MQFSTGEFMRDITITANDAGRRLDRFLRKYLRNASLGEIYKLIRKDIKVDGRRRDQSYILQEGETLSLYISDDVLERLTGSRASTAASGRNGRPGSKARKQFRIIYEDRNILIADKPYGLLTHGDRNEKKNHLANQVKDYLISRGEFDPLSEKVFSPAPANRLDRNTTGLVLFGKTAAALKGLNMMIREDLTDKFYLTIVHGIIDEEIALSGGLVKDETQNKVTITQIKASRPSEEQREALFDEGRSGRSEGEPLPVLTEVRPVEVIDFGSDMKATLVEIRLVTGRSHQIRAHMAGIGHPVIGDSKYAGASAEGKFRSHASGPQEIRRLNEYLARTYGLTTQLLHAYRLSFAQSGLPEDLAYLSGRSFTAPLPPAFRKILGRDRFE